MGAGPGSRRYLAGNRLRRSIRYGSATARLSWRHPEGVRAVRFGRFATGETDRLRRQGKLEGNRRELSRVLPLPWCPSPAEPDHPIQLGELSAVNRRGDEQLHGGSTAVRNAFDDRGGGRAGAYAGDDGGRSQPYLLLRRLAES